MTIIKEMNPVKTVAIVAHLEKDIVVKHTKELIASLSRRGLQVVVPESDEALIGKHKNVKAVKSLAADLVIVLGGDGTILKAIRLLKDKRTPLLGVNFGKVGFLAEIEIDALPKVLTKALKRECVLEKRGLIEATVYEKSGKPRRFLALNEVVIERKLFGILIELDVMINDKHFNRYFADGIIISTPTGSSAYSFSAGGPVVSPETKTILITPICAHSLFNRTVVLSDKEQVKITCNSEQRSGVILNIDGRQIVEVDELTHVDIKMSGVCANLVKANNRSYYEILRDKLRVWDLPAK